ncbi:copper-binding protein [Acidovorax sp. NCPPB 3576]|uniref:copper-binding protein n=1 Tax=Acidovorax sp. NCPPB 3576 TaxID=2940488 RepID=UPI00234AC56D|nr:copper-binding protein [Acidovorax sp. NCPPB 3576]WCM89971.1 copper-binding protein [Acidovorax sp. NCPPB 3576]
MTRRPALPTIAAVAAIALALAGTVPAQASSHGPSGHAGHAAAPAATAHAEATALPGTPSEPDAAAPAPDTELARGEVVRWDPAAGKLTLRHGELKNLAMPPMTMVFRLQDPAPDVPLAPGTPVRFHAESQRGALVITRIEAVR